MLALGLLAHLPWSAARHDADRPISGIKPCLLRRNRSYRIQVKALFLFNFSKYVDWPSEAFATANAPIVIGVIGGSVEGKFLRELARTVQAKNVDGRSILVRQIQTLEDLDKCHVLFIRSSEKTRLGEILGGLKTRPVLTVSETDQFLEEGGVINFVKKEGKIRLEINLDAARQANLQISSKLLNVADVVKGKLK